MTVVLPERTGVEHLASAREAAWSARLDDLRAYVESADGLVPSAGLSDEEKSLAAWLSAQRRRGRARLAPKRSEALDRVLPGWDSGTRADSRSPREVTWHRNLADAIAWTSSHGRLPQRRDGAGAEEVRLASWLSDQRKAVKGQRRGMSARREAILDRDLAGWRGTQLGTSEEQWRANASAYVRWTRKHGRRPGWSGSRVETRHHRWEHNQRNSAFGNGNYAMTAERLEFLDLHAPWWRVPANRATALEPLPWAEGLAGCVVWLAQHGSLPDTSDDAQLATWLAEQRRRRHAGERDLLTMAREERMHLDIPGWWSAKPEHAGNAPRGKRRSPIGHRLEITDLDGRPAAACQCGERFAWKSDQTVIAKRLHHAHIDDLLAAVGL